MTPSLYKKHTPFFIATLPLPPGINGSHATGRTGRIKLTQSAVQFNHDASLLLSRAQVADWDIIHTIVQSKRKIPVYIFMHFYFKTLWRRDVDGGIKAVQDAIFTHFGAKTKDNRAVWVEALKSADRTYQRVEIAVSLVEEVA